MNQVNYNISYVDDLIFLLYKETSLERADFTLQLLMVDTEKGKGNMFTIFFSSIFGSYCPRRHFRQGHAKRVQTRKAYRVPAGLKLSFPLL